MRKYQAGLILEAPQWKTKTWFGAGWTEMKSPVGALEFALALWMRATARVPALAYGFYLKISVEGEEGQLNIPRSIDSTARYQARLILEAPQWKTKTWFGAGWTEMKLPVGALEFALALWVRATARGPALAYGFYLKISVEGGEGLLNIPRSIDSTDTRYP